MYLANGKLQKAIGTYTLPNLRNNAQLENPPKIRPPLTYPKYPSQVPSQIEV